jgi:hypothetical protein
VTAGAAKPGQPGCDEAANVQEAGNARAAIGINTLNCIVPTSQNDA